jgi:hypothetical protein
MKQALVVVALAMPALGCDEGHATTFVALESNFADFRAWRRVPLGSDPLPGHPPGPRFGYVNRSAPRGQKAYSVGTIIVKTVEPSTAPETWELFAMTKRGGDFNAEGARDWEFFRLRWVNGAPRILPRGRNAIDPEGEGGAGYFGNLGDAFANMCNGCHGTAASAATDHVLSPALAPGR